MNQIDWEKTIEWVSIVAGCVIKQDGKYLVVQEKGPKVYGLWNLPAGRVDKGETIEEAAIREVNEETGYNVELLEEIGVYHKSVGTSVKHIFRAKIVGGELKIQEDEILDVKWVSFEEIKALKEASKLREPWIWDVVCKVEQVKDY